MRVFVDKALAGIVIGGIVIDRADVHKVVDTLSDNTFVRQRFVRQRICQTTRVRARAICQTHVKQNQVVDVLRTTANFPLPPGICPLLDDEIDQGLSGDEEEVERPHASVKWSWKWLLLDIHGANRPLFEIQPTNQPNNQPTKQPV